MNAIDNMKKSAISMLQMHMDDVCGEMAASMKQRLSDGGHIDTGNLYNSINHKTEADDKKITSCITIDAVSDNGAWYAEFLEYGTGIYNENGDGRTTPWRYKDREGNWHTTQGMEADPFIRPSIAEHLGELEQGIEHTLGELKRYGK